MLTVQFFVRQRRNSRYFGWKLLSHVSWSVRCFFNNEPIVISLSSRLVFGQLGYSRVNEVRSSFSSLGLIRSTVISRRTTVRLEFGGKNAHPLVHPESYARRKKRTDFRLCTREPQDNVLTNPSVYSCYRFWLCSRSLIASGFGARVTVIGTTRCCRGSVWGGGGKLANQPCVRRPGSRWKVARQSA